MSDDNRGVLLTNCTTTSQHWSHAEQIRWTSLYNYLMASSVLLLAWAAVFASAPTNPGRQLVLFVLSVVGLLTSLAWLFLGLRGNGFVWKDRQPGSGLEGQLGIQGPFAETEKYRDEVMDWRIRWFRSDLAVTGVPILFALLYVVLGGIAVFC